MDLNFENKAKSELDRITLKTQKVDLALMDDIKKQFKVVRDTNRKLLDIESDFLKKRTALKSFSEILNEQSKRLLELCNDIEQASNKIGIDTPKEVELYKKEAKDYQQIAKQTSKIARN